MQQDQFCITFGKDDWSKFQANKTHINTNLNSPTKTCSKIQSSHQHTVSKTARSAQQTNNKPTHKKNNIYKENHQLYEDFYQHHKHPTKNAPKLKHKNTYQTNKTKPTMINDPLYPSYRANQYISDDSSHVSFKQTISKTQLPKKKYFQNYIEQQNPKHTRQYIDPWFDKYQIVKTAKKNHSAHQHENKLSQYKEEMNKLDSLINRINQRISVSNAKFAI